MAVSEMTVLEMTVLETDNSLLYDSNKKFYQLLVICNARRLS
jgi:hypothetical protein